jgi:hypothetical protein
MDSKIQNRITSLYIYVYHNCVFQTTIYLEDTQNHSQVLGRFQIA